MDTKYSDIKPVLPQGILLSTFGVLLTTIFTGFFIYWISGFSNVSITMSLMTAMLLAATMSSTDSASVFNILRSQSMNLKHNLRPMLELESGSNDPFAYMLTVIVLSFMKGENSVGQMVYSIAAQIVFGVLIGFLIALGAVWFMKHFTFNTSGFDAAFVLGVAVLAYALPTLVGGNGYLSAYIVGIVLGNQNIHNKKSLVHFLTE